jgi:cytochrome c heme-lyase
VKHTSGDANMGAKHIFGLPASVEEAAKHPQSPLPDQVVPLSTHRVVSSIPRGPGEEKEGSNQKKAPQHQPSDGKNWVYPSEQQFYNAMRRKGWVIDDEATVPEVVQIHNAVNERGWHQVRNWEETLHGNTNPRLVKFLGRPKDTSPKAFFNTWFLGYHAPFDRHDWYIDRNDGRSEPIRYVIDFYSGNETNTSFTSGEQKDTLMKRPPAMYLDVRPAIDSPEALVDRIQMFARDAFPGITAAFASSTQNSTNTSPHHDKDTTPSSK